MFDGMSSPQDRLETIDKKMIHQPEESNHVINVCIPKVEPYYSTRDEDSNDESLSYNEMVSPIPFTAPYKVRDPIVLLEKCDKIWETLQLIKDVQSEDNDKIVDNGPQSVQTPVVSENLNKLETSNKPISSYIEYQPTLENISTVLPNLKISVKSKKKLYHCVTCGKQYTENRSLREHSVKIHGIYIPPKRHRSSLKKSEELEGSKVVAKDTDKTANVDDKKDHQELREDLDTVKFNSRLQKRRNLSLSNSNNTTVSDIETNECKSNRPNNKLQQSQKTNSVQSTRLLCVLCKHFVIDIKNHLIDYHKIECADVMIKDLEKTSAAETIIKSKDKESKDKKSKVKESKTSTATSNKLVEKGPVSAVSKQTVPSKHRMDTLETSLERPKRKATTTQVNPAKRHKGNDDVSHTPTETSQNSHSKKSTLQCDICFGTYTRPQGLRKHKRIHHLHGETKENFHLFECRYPNSPLFLKWKTTVNTTNLPPASGNTNNLKEISRNVSEKRRTRQQTSISTSDGEQRSEQYNYDSTETTCNCGRSFRNPHTLFIHKSKCKFQVDGEQQCIKNNSDRDSGIGINITIKKKNDSYEIVGKDSSEENNQKDSDYLKDKDTASDTSDCTSEDFSNEQTNTQDIETLELSKYSKDHSILKLMLVDEDIDVDVEADSQDSTSNNTIEDTTTTEELENTSNKENNVETQIKVDTGIRQKNVSSLKFLCRKVLLKNKLIKRKSRVRSIKWYVKKKLCICGKKYSNKSALKIHIFKNHRYLLTCAYCNESFSDFDKRDTHKCPVDKGKTFSDPLDKIPCHYCPNILIGERKFDEHILVKHSDPNNPYQCFNCPKRFLTNSIRDEHFIKEHSITCCSFCEKKCHISIKARHEGYHLGLGYPCHLCKRTYPARHVLTRHRKMVHENINSKMFIEAYDSDTYEAKCNVCGLSFENKEHLGQHLLKKCM